MTGVVLGREVAIIRSFHVRKPVYSVQDGHTQLFATAHKVENEIKLYVLVGTFLMKIILHAI